jgi:hypothetical protein
MQELVRARTREIAQYHSLLSKAGSLLFVLISARRGMLYAATDTATRGQILIVNMNAA